MIYMNIETYKNYLVKWIRQQVAESKLNGVVVGVSGGIDSAVVAALAQQACPDNYLVLSLPCFSSAETLHNTNLLIETLNLNSKTVDLSTQYDTFIHHIEDPSITNSSEHSLAVATGSLKARLRMVTLYYLAQTLNYLVLGTDNAAEWYLGYFTKYGDGAADLVPLIHMTKQDVVKMAALLHIPSTIIQAQPTADLWPGQTDEGELGFAYHDVDKYLQREAVSPIVAKKIDQWHVANEHKRHLALKPDKKPSDLR